MSFKIFCICVLVVSYMLLLCISSESGFLDKQGNLFGGGLYTLLAPTDKAFNDYFLSLGGNGSPRSFNYGDNGVIPGIERLKQNTEELDKVTQILIQMKLVTFSVATTNVSTICIYAGTS